MSAATFFGNDGFGVGVGGGLRGRGHRRTDSDPTAMAHLGDRTWLVNRRARSPFESTLERVDGSVYLDQPGGRHAGGSIEGFGGRWQSVTDASPRGAFAPPSPRGR